MTTPTDPGEVLLLGASRLHRLQIEKLNALEISLTLRQYRILQRVSEGYTSASDLSRLAHRSLPTTSESIDGLIKRGLLTRAGSDSDRRAVVLGMTAQGRAALTAAGECLTELAKSMTDGLSATKRKAAEDLGRRMYQVSGRILWDDES